MPLEEEMTRMLIGGFSFVMGIALVSILFLWFRNKNQHVGYGWTILHLLLCSLAIFMVIDTLDSDYNHPMASEENSLRLGISGIIWACSMISLLVGILFFSKNNKERKVNHEEY